MALRVSDVARDTGISPDAVRYYEREGLLPAPARSASGYREFDETTPRRIRFIKGAQEMGLKLSEIRELLEIQDKGACPCGHTRSIVERRIGEIDAEMTRLSELRAQLNDMAKLECPSNVDGDMWPCEATFLRRGGENLG